MITKAQVGYNIKDFLFKLHEIMITYKIEFTVFDKKIIVRSSIYPDMMLAFDTEQPMNDEKIIYTLTKLFPWDRKPQKVHESNQKIHSKNNKTVV